ncbi:energy-coupling factor ABC transporter ATP-binding protein [Infirmifilum uzonense]|uniref:energy-coupling factor ABC transporter ATP-binding protein n=1 Tax=Infirmifilum uzonense TaxID=1550241 RepID=UPI003C740872
MPSLGVLVLVELEGVYYRYPDSSDWVLKNINFKAGEGEFILILGPSGCGKSTLARVLNGLIPNFYGGLLDGKINIVGNDPREVPTYEMSRHVGFVFQNPENQLFFTNVEREVAFGLENLGYPPDEIRRRVLKVLEEYDLMELREKSPFELSGGQQQKVALASVMALEPRVLILDEPTANLDPLSALKVLGLVKKKTLESKLATLVIEHRLEIVLPFAERVVVMAEGEIVYDGDPLGALERYGYLTGKPFIIRLIERLEKEGIQLKAKSLSPEDVAASLLDILERGVTRVGGN